MLKWFAAHRSLLLTLTQRAFNPHQILFDRPRDPSTEDRLAYV